jgi:hypothetical protein
MVTAQNAKKRIPKIQASLCVFTIEKDVSAFFEVKDLLAEFFRERFDLIFLTIVSPDLSQ